MITTICAKNKSESLTIEVPKGFKKVNVLSWHKKESKYYELSPYFLKTDGNEGDNIKEGILFENFWQGSKVYEYTTSMTVKPYFASKLIWWKYDTEEEKEYHYENEELTENYFRWQNSVFDCPNPIRYPNTYARKHKVLFSRIIRKNKEKRYNYLEARKKIYVKEYKRLIRKLNIYQELLQDLNNDINLCIVEVDVTDENKKGYYGKYANRKLTLKRLNKLLNDDSHPFGHGLALSIALLEDKK